MIAVLDACALIAFLRGEPGADVVRAMFDDPDTECMAHAINLCEVFYDAIRDTGEDKASAALQDLQEIGLVTREDMDSQFWQQAGRYKAHNRLSLADCLALALADRVMGELMTTDHHEFDAVVQKGIGRVKFIR